MDSQDNAQTAFELPKVAEDYIEKVIKRMRYRKVRSEVKAELHAHFEDALSECRNDRERQEVAEQLIETFGDIKFLAKLIRRAKKRCRPLWAKVLIRVFQAVGVCVLYFIVCVGRLYIGSPTVKVDTVAWINDTVRQKRDESLNALPGIEKAMALLTSKPEPFTTKYPHYQDMNDVELQFVEAYLEKNQAALNTLRAAVNKPYYWRQYDPVPVGIEDSGAALSKTRNMLKTVELSGHLVGQVMSDLPKYRELAFALKCQAQWYCAQEKVELALADAMTLVQFGHQVTGTGLLVEQLVGVAISSLGIDTVLELVRDLNVNESLLAETHSALDNLFVWDRPWLDFTAEKALVDDMIQYGFTDDGQGNGRPLASGLLLLGSSPIGWWKNLLLFDYPDRKQVAEHIEEFYQNLQQWQMITPWQRRDRGYTLVDNEISTMYSALIKPAMEKTSDQAWRLKVHYQAVLMVLAVKLYETRHGVLPESLDALLADGLMTMPPRDFYSDGPLQYQRKTDKDFVLYSCGEDLKDDNGTPSTNENGEPRRYGPHGDWIFWPLDQ